MIRERPLGLSWGSGTMGGMTQLLKLRWVPFVLLALPWLQSPSALGNTKYQQSGSFLDAVRATPMGDDAAKAFFLAELLRNAPGGSPWHEQVLRKELMHTYLQQFKAPPPPSTPVSAPPSAPSRWEIWLSSLPGRAPPAVYTVADALERGQRRTDVFDPSFRSAWQTAFEQNLSVRWGAGPGRLPDFLLEMRDLELVAPGAWAAPTADGRVRLKLALRLLNPSRQAVPVYPPGLSLGPLLVGGTPLRLDFACQWDRLPAARRQASTKANAVTVLPPGGESELLVCEAPSAPAFWRAQLPGLVSDSAKPQLASHDLDSPNHLNRWVQAMAEFHPPPGAWNERLQIASQDKKLTWRTASKPLESPERGAALVPYGGWEHAAEKFSKFMLLSALCLGFFAATRALQRHGLPKSIALLGVVVAGFFLMPLVLNSARSGILGYMLLLPILLMQLVAVLLWLHKLLDKEGLAWWEVVLTGWRRTFDLQTHTSRAEFWGGVVHGLWLGGLALYCLRPLDRWVGWALLLPLTTLVVRRLRSMTREEHLEGRVIVVTLLAVFGLIWVLRGAV